MHFLSPACQVAQKLSPDTSESTASALQLPERSIERVQKGDHNNPDKQISRGICPHIYPAVYVIRAAIIALKCHRAAASEPPLHCNVQRIAACTTDLHFLHFLCLTGTDEDYSAYEHVTDERLSLLQHHALWLKWVRAGQLTFHTVL